MKKILKSAFALIMVAIVMIGIHPVYVNIVSNASNGEDSKVGVIVSYESKEKFLQEFERDLV